MSIYLLKPWFRQKLSGVTARLRHIGVTPNQITITALVLSILYSASLYVSSIFHLYYLYLFFPLFAIIRMALNAIDGLMASEYDMKTPLGMILNEVGDIVSDFCLMLAFIYSCSLPLIVFIFIILTICSEVVGILGLAISQVRHYEGPMGKSDRIFVLSLMAWIFYAAIYFSQSNLIYTNYCLWANSLIMVIALILLIKTIYNRYKANFVKG